MAPKMAPEAELMKAFPEQEIIQGQPFDLEFIAHNEGGKVNVVFGNYEGDPGDRLFNAMSDRAHTNLYHRQKQVGNQRYEAVYHIHNEGGN